MDFSGMMDVVMPLLFIIYGIKFLRFTPEFGKNGFATKWSRKSPEAWAMAHRYGGRLCVAFGAFIGALGLLRYYLFHGVPAATGVIMGVEFACIVSLIPLVNRKLKKHFDDKGRPK